MKIGIDISQIVYKGTGVATYVENLVYALVKKYPHHEYVLFGASLRQRHAFSDFKKRLDVLSSNVSLVSVPIPPTVLDMLWNRLHIIPVSWFIGNVSIFWSSDWTQPPLGNIPGVTTIHDLSPFIWPNESHNQTTLNPAKMQIKSNIVAIHNRRLQQAKRSCVAFFVDSQASYKDVNTILGISESKIHVVYPGLVR